MATTDLAVPENHGIVNYTAAIQAVGDKFLEKAQWNVHQQLADMRANGDPREFGALEIRAMEQIEALKLVSGLDLYSILLRHQFLVTIRNDNLLLVHPGRYNDQANPLSAMAADQGISVSELHDILKLGDVIFPFLTAEYGENAIAEMWERLGKAKFRELTPMLVSAINGTPSQSRNVRQAIETATEAAALQHAVESTLPWQEVPPAERQRRVAREVVQIAENAPSVRTMVDALRGRTGTEDILFLERQMEGRTVIIAEVNADQKLMIARIMSTHAEFQPLNDADAGFGNIASNFDSVQAMIERARVRLVAPTEETTI